MKQSLETAITQAEWNRLLNNKTYCEAYEEIVRDLLPGRTQSEVIDLIWEIGKDLYIAENKKSLANYLFYLFIPQEVFNLFDEICENDCVLVPYELCEAFENLYRFETCSSPMTDDCNDRGIYYSVC